MRSQFTTDRYRYTEDGDLWWVELARIRVERGDIICEVEIWYNGVEDAGLLHSGKLNLVSDRTVTTLANTLHGRVDTVDWYSVLTAITYSAKKRYREGEPPIKLSDVTSEEAKWLIRPFIEMSGPTILAAPGGSAKSMLALAVSASVASGRGLFLKLNPRVTGPVLYLDWEADKFAHRNRLEAMCRAVELAVPDNLYYRREYAPLHESSEELSRHVADIGAVLLVVDSKGASLSGAPEEADGTLRFFRGLRSIGIPSLVVDHVTNASAAGKGPSRPFGSVYTQNMARNVWMAKRTDSEEGQTTVLWQHTKSNNGPTGKQLAWRMDFLVKDANTDQEKYEAIHITQVAPITVAAMPSGGFGLKEDLRLAMMRRREPLSVGELVDLTGASDSQVRARLAEGAKEGLFVNISPGTRYAHWLLADDDKQTKGL